MEWFHFLCNYILGFWGLILSAGSQADSKADLLSNEDLKDNTDGKYQLCVQDWVCFQWIGGIGNACTNAHMHDVSFPLMAELVSDTLT